MGAPVRFGMFGLQPALSPELAVPRVGALPFGGPTGTGLAFSQGQALGDVQVAAQSEVATLTFTGAATGGTFNVSFIGDKVYQTPNLAYNISLANFQAALIAAVPEFAGNLTVTGTASTSGTGGTYTCTFNTNLANQRIGGLFVVSTALTGGSSPAGAWARTTRGSCGPGQLDVYNSSTNNRVDAFLKYDVTLSPGGSVVAPGAAAPFTSPNQPSQPTVYFEGVFNESDLVGLDSNAYTLGKLTKMPGGLARLI
ncbi:hypothetical protein VT84_09310 [Gemmata sp. SH-PL17]|uniref:hypothetical protein n=1 Tax=Gemmata sp. SH-PL17 TaxID=1630693 RepID=UPI00078D290C|nr:hypothetical protein [Gemmata sp. SH-PL17]AMV24581.1 hypothetical protein VT84_09310 [Gemmata sp. SH-PL17]